MKTALLVAYVLFLVGFGTYCLFLPGSVQARAIRAVDTGLTARIPMLRRHVASKGYLISVRIVGIVAYVMAIVLAVGFYRAIE